MHGSSFNSNLLILKTQEHESHNLETLTKELHLPQHDFYSIDFIVQLLDSMRSALKSLSKNDARIGDMIPAYTIVTETVKGMDISHHAITLKKHLIECLLV